MTECATAERPDALELYASATGIVYETKKALEKSDADTALRSMENITAKDIFDLAKEGDAFAAEQVDKTGAEAGTGIGKYRAGW